MRRILLFQHIIWAVDRATFVNSFDVYIRSKTKAMQSNIVPGIL